MTRALALALVLTACLGATHVSAQTAARRLVAAGEVTGLEMSIDGALHAPPGGTLRWLVTTYEVLRRRDLRVAGGIELTVTASYSDGPALFTTRSDAQGHALIELTLPSDLEGAPQIAVEAISPRGVRRVFDAPLEVDPIETIALVADREVVPPGGSVALLARVCGTADLRPRAGASVRISLRSAALVRAPITLQTDASGVIATELELPSEPGTYSIEVMADDGQAMATRAITVAADSPPSLWARVESTRAVARPGETVPVEVRVLAADGTPVSGARVDWSDDPAREDEVVVRTDARGQATLAWAIERTASPGGSVEERTREVRVVHAAHGTTNGTAHVRIAREASYAVWAVEDGALVPGVRSSLFVRVVSAEGTPRAGVGVALVAGDAGPAASATTDRDGVAELPVRAAETRPELDGCGGPTSVGATLTIDGREQTLCLPVEPDALVAVGAETAASGLVVSLARRPEVEARTVSVTALVHRGEAWLPIARTFAAPRESRVTLALPPLGVEEIWVRARVVVDGQEALGGGTIVLAGAAPAMPTLEADAAGARIATSDASAVALAVEASSALSLEARLGTLSVPLALARAEGHGDAFVRAVAAASTPRDTAAPVALREGTLVPLAMPDDAVAQGLLRDPWRTRARFVRGRLGALMRAVEQLVDARVPDRIDEVGVRENGHWRFDREMLEAAMVEAGLGDERAAALDGEPLDIDALTTLDPDFTYDHVARRITRERLFRVLWYLRTLVRERQLDLAWARRGDPREYVVALLEASVGFEVEYPERSHLFDAWGHPFVLVAVRGTPRFDRFQPVPGYELVSAGPDGQVGNGDDVFDPFARVLSPGSVYAEAVQEDELVARLGGVELGRATVETLAEAFAIETEVFYDVDVAGAMATWGTEPAPIDPTPVPYAPLPRVARALFAGAVGPGQALSGSWTPPSERRAYVGFALALDADGGVSLARRAFEAGAPTVAHADVPALLRVGDSLRVPIRFVPLTREPAPDARASATSSSEAVTARVEGSDLVLEARRAGVSRLTVALEAPGAPRYEMQAALRVLPEGALHAAHAGTIAGGTVALPLQPPGERPWRARWVVSTGRALRRDPLFTEGPGRDAAASAWADVLAGTDPSAEDLAALEGALAVEPRALHTACALVTWATTDEDLLHDLRFTRAAGALDDVLPASLSSRAAVLAALAPVAPSSGDPSSSAVASVVSSLRDDAWRALATERDTPATLAEMAAALLLVDRDDVVARALFERARAAASPTDGLGPDVHDALAGTLALVVAARQLGEDALADELARGVIGRLYLAPRLGAETVFWALAASTFGALGADAAGPVTVDVGGATRELSLAEGPAVLDDLPADASVRVHAGAPVVVRGELRALSSYRPADGLPIDVRIEGDVGVLGERASLELVVESTTDEVLSDLVVELALPASAALDATARDAMASAAGGSVGEPDAAGVLRLRISELRGRTMRRIPLPWRWRATGASRGLGITVFSAAQPWTLTTRPDRFVETTAP
ncbi:MAG: hypothetical protein U0234_22180 [Sandaracinus sp.]